VIVVDASAICAIVFAEPERAEFMAVLKGVDSALVSPVNRWEASVSVQQRRPDVAADRIIQDILGRAGIVVADIGADEASVAFEAWRTFGKGRHPAALNLGDCFAYALASTRNLPLLFKGDDFARTDIRSAL
jgi:ribonuclease VapC